MKSAIAIVECKEHGTKNMKNGDFELKVNIPRNKRVGRQGCPVCLKRSKAQER